MKIAKYGTALAAAGIAALALAVPAQAHGAPFTIKAGTAPVGTTVAVTKTSGTLSFKDTTTNANLTCASTTIKGSVRVGSSNGNPVVTLNGAGVVFNGCTGPAGLKFAVTGYGTWNINITDSTNGVSTGTVTNIRAHVKSTAGPTCGFDIGANSGTFTSSGTSTVAPGYVPGTFTNSSQNVNVPATNPGSLGIWNLKGSGTNTYCVSPSIIKRGDLASVSATWKLQADVAAYNPVTVT